MCIIPIYYSVSFPSVFSTLVFFMTPYFPKQMIVCVLFAHSANTAHIKQWPLLQSDDEVNGSCAGALLKTGAQEEKKVHR